MDVLYYPANANVAQKACPNLSPSSFVSPTLPIIHSALQR